MTISFQRLLIILLSLIFFITSILLIMINSKKNFIFFYTPTELLVSNLQTNESVRIGGFVKKNSLNNEGSNKYSFIVTDNSNSIYVKYEGLLPDLFREEQGIVIEGIIISKNQIEASTVFAKHDENYLPETIKKQLKENKYWQKEYK